MGLSSALLAGNTGVKTLEVVFKNNLMQSKVVLVLN
jgi:F0F1-type ATP synthase membrane subunit c/vacuolar-type H+-ATPase subunit K